MSICTATAGLAATVPVTVDGFDYDITTITGTFNAYESLLMDQVWWGNDTLAEKFSDTVAAALGFPNIQAGPLFAFGLSQSPFSSTPVRSFVFLLRIPSL